MRILGEIMKTNGKIFKVRGSHGIDKTMFIRGESDGAFKIHMVTRSPYGVMESDEMLTRELFESCLRTGFIQEIKNSSALPNLTFASV